MATAGRPHPRRLPPGFALERGRRGLLGRADDVARALDAAGFGPDGDRSPIPESELSGRHPLGAIAADGRRLLVRRYAHGGLLRWLTGERFADPGRPFDELALAHALRERGVRTPRVVAARAVRAGRLPGWRLALVSERVEGAVDLATLVERARRGELPARERAEVTRELGRLLAELHAIGLEHVDLQLRNLLVEREAPAGARLWVLDLDRSRLGATLDLEVRERNLARLLRGARRRDRRGPRVLTRTDLARFWIAYAGREDWRAWHARVARRLAREGRRHRLGWWLERLFRADPARRDGTARIGR